MYVADQRAYPLAAFNSDPAITPTGVTGPGWHGLLTPYTVANPNRAQPGQDA